MAAGIKGTRVFEAIASVNLLEKYFPMLLQGGILDYDLMVHSHFLTYLATVGQSLGMAAVVECPIISFPNVPERAYGEVRPDSVWFDKESLEPKVAIEFERFERGHENKLRQKVENLAIAVAQAEALELCVLIYWVKSGQAPRSMEAILSSYYQGFRRSEHRIPAARIPLVVIKCALKPQGENLVFSEFLRDIQYERWWR